MSGLSVWNLSKIAWSCGLPCPFDWASTFSVTVARVFAPTLAPATSAVAATSASATMVIVQRRGEDCFPITGTYLLGMWWGSCRTRSCGNGRGREQAAAELMVATDDL